MMAYNLTALYNASNAADLATFANDATNGLLFAGFCLAVFIVALTRTQSDIAGRLAVASYVCFVLSGVMILLGVLNWIFLVLFAVVAALSTLWMYLH